MSTMSAIHTVTLMHRDGSEVDVPMSGSAILDYVFDPEDADIVSVTIPVRRPAPFRSCSVCGGMDGEHDWEVHNAEVRASSRDY